MLWINLTQVEFLLNDHYFDDNNHNDYNTFLNNDVDYKEIDNNDDCWLLNFILSM